MDERIDRLLASTGGVAGRAELVRAVGRFALDNEVRRARLTAVFPRAYARPWDADQAGVRERAALVSVGGDVALSHLSALARWDLPVIDDAPIHVTAYQPRHPRGVRGELVVHRTLRPLAAAETDGVPVVRADEAIVSSWPLMSGAEQRAPLIVAARRGLVPPARIAPLADHAWWIRGIAGLRELVRLVLAGCESELELWGYTDVFDVAGLRDVTRQLVVRAGDRTYRLDMAYEEEMLAVELDGRRYHSGPEQWERDIARDLALATLGWQTIRFSHARLTSDVAGCRKDALAVRAARRRRLAG